VLAQELAAVPTAHTPDGGATQDPDAWWDGIRSGIRSLLRVVSPDGLLGVGITGQWGSTVPVDAKGRPAGP